MLLSILEELASNNSTNYKIEVLKKYSDNETLKEFFRLCLDKQINYYIKKIPKYNTAHEGSISIEAAMSSLRKLYDRVFTGNKAKIFLSKLLTSCNERDAEILKRIINRDAACKVSHSTVNKIWDNLIKIWPCQLCERSTDKNLANIKYPAIIQEKSDGLRFNIIFRGDEIEYRSRKGNHVQTLGVLEAEVRQIAEHVEGDFVLDGEALFLKPGVRRETDGAFWLAEDVVVERTIGNGMGNSAIQNTIDIEAAERLVVNLWDIIPLDVFEGRSEAKTPYIETIKKLKTIMDSNQFEKFGMVLTNIIKNQDQAFKHYALMLSKGKEGSIIKNCDMVWEDKRSKDAVKLKLKESCDLIVIDTFPHKKKPEWIGGLVAETSCGRVRVNVGSGFDDAARAKNDEYIGKIIEVETNGLTKDEKKETYSLFLPIFKGVREDKTTADSFEDIKNILEAAISGGV